jgi:hypothetical protein
MTPLVSTNPSRRLAELRFCIEELRRRQQTDGRRAWLWQLKEKAARQAMVMLQTEVGDESRELSAWEQRQIMSSHWLLKDPRMAAQATDMPKWRRELQAHARLALQQSLEQIQRRREQTASA